MRRKQVLMSGMAAMRLIVLAMGAIGCGQPSLYDDSLYQQQQAASANIMVGGRLEGSGCFIDSSGLVLTAGHVVAGKAGPFEVMSPAEGRLPADVLATDFGHDLALLRVAARAKPYPALSIAERAPAPGQPIYIYGTPMFRTRLLLNATVAEGQTSYEYSSTYQDYVQMFHLSGPSPHGTSGGSWVDGQGRVVGVQSGLLVHEKAAVGIGFAAPPWAIRQLVNSRKTVITPSIGSAVEDLFERPRDVIAKYPPGQTGVMVERLRKGGPFDTAGLTAGLLIIALDGRPIPNRYEFLDRIRANRPGDQVRLRVMDSSKNIKEVMVRLGTMAPQPQTQPQSQPQSRPQTQPKPLPASKPVR